MSAANKSNVTINQLSEEGYGDRRSIKKWLAADGVEAVGGFYDRKAAIRCLKQHKRAAIEDDESENKKGTAYSEKLAQEVIKLKRENRIAEKLENETYMLTDDVEKMMLMGINKLENVPSKMESEFGLPPHQTKRLTALCDEVRQEWAKQLKAR